MLWIYLSEVKKIHNIRTQDTYTRYVCIKKTYQKFQNYPIEYLPRITNNLQSNISKYNKLSL